jgi:hypothetical protein
VGELRGRRYTLDPGPLAQTQRMLR